MGKSGPKKIRPLDFGELTKRIQEPEHVSRRSHVAIRLEIAIAEAVSCRELDFMNAAVRRETNRKRSAQTSLVS